MVAGGNSPGFEKDVDIVIKREATFLRQAECGHGGDGLADGSGLEERVELDWAIRLNIHDAVTLRPLHFEVLDDGDAEAGDMEELHDLLQREAVEALAIGRLGSFDAGDDGGGVACRIRGWKRRLCVQGAKKSGAHKEDRA
jgi:hypothetical protein